MGAIKGEDEDSKKPHGRYRSAVGTNLFLIILGSREREARDLNYKFSGVCCQQKLWIPPLPVLRDGGYADLLSGSQSLSLSI